MSFERDQSEVDARLQAMGIPHGIRHLTARPVMCREIFPQLLELMKAPFSLDMRSAIAAVLFESRPEIPKKQELMKVLLGILREHVGTNEKSDYLRLAKFVGGYTVVDGVLVDNVDASQVGVLGEMVLDKRFGEVREQFTYALRKIGSPEAIGFLEQATRDPQTAAHALRALVLLREDDRTLALCEEALKLPGLTDPDAVQTLTRMQSRMGYQRETTKVDAWLAERGIQQGIEELYEDPTISPDCVPELLELYKSPCSLQMHAVVSRAIVIRKPNAAQKREFAEAMLALLRKHKGWHDHFLSTMVLNELANSVGPDKVHELGQMMLDKGYGELRDELAFTLCKFRNADAISYLKQAAKVPEIASAALYSLAHMRVEGALELCEEALKQPGVLHKSTIKETYKKLQRKLAKKKAAVVSHVTGELVPEGFEEWSANIDASELSKVLRGVQKCVEAGFGKAEIAEIKAAAEDLSPDVASEDEERDIVRLKFNVQFNGSDRELWLEVFCDDEDAYDLYIFGTAKLIEEIERVLKTVMPD